MKAWILIILGLWFSGRGWAQGKGGGIYLKDNASCIGSVVYNNQAEDGFGVGGENATVLNVTVVGNEPIKQDSTRTAPGYIYCANGDIVDTTDYKARTEKDAIGIVFWVRGDWTALDQKGAVVALEEGFYSWGTVDGLEVTAMYQDEEWGAFAYLKDTACYRHTADMEEMYKTYREFEAGHYCYHFEAEMQQEAGLTSPRWCMPTYLYLKRIFGVLPIVEHTLEFLKRVHLQSGKSIRIRSFTEGKNRNDCWYWSADDGMTESMSRYAYIVNFMTGSMGAFTETQSEKTSKNYTRPIFIY